MSKSPFFEQGWGEPLAWPPEETLSTFRFRYRARLEIARAGEAQRDAIAYLLQSQRKDGSWSNPMEPVKWKEGPDYVTNFTEAITAISGMGLLPYREDAAVQDAVDQAMGFLLKAHQKHTDRFQQRFRGGDFSVWRHAYVLWFFADCIAERIGDRGRLAASYP